MRTSPGEHTDEARLADGPEVLIVDDHELVSTALVLALNGQGLTAWWMHPHDLVADMAGPGPGGGLVLLDLDLGRDREGAALDGARLVPTLRRTGWRVLVLTGSADESRVAAAVAAGAVGWMAKSAPFEHLVATTVQAADGRTVLDTAERNRLCALAAEAVERGTDLDRRWAQLTQREREVLGRLVAGHRAAEIAEEFVVSLATVRTQIRSILAKLEVTSQLQAVALARQRYG